MLSQENQELVDQIAIKVITEERAGTKKVTSLLSDFDKNLKTFNAKLENATDKNIASVSALKGESLAAISASTQKIIDHHQKQIEFMAGSVAVTTLITIVINIFLYRKIIKYINIVKTDKNIKHIPVTSPAHFLKKEPIKFYSQRV